MNNSSFDRIPWIFFDLDDTLWNFTENSEDSLHKLYGISPILRKLFPDFKEFIEIYHNNNSLMWDLYSQGKVTTSELKNERWRRTLATRQFEVLTAVCEELDRNYLEILAQGQAKIKGVEEMLSELVKNSLIAVLSNGFSTTQYKKLHYSGLEKYVTRTIVSEEIGINKPAKPIFEYAVSETGAQSPFLMVGDNLDSDILGAINAGWYAIWYNPLKKEFPYAPEFFRLNNLDPKLFLANVSSIEELKKAIKEFLIKNK
ncbi:MAG: YjjG family noncanonical pyrimidine nucleotidase [Muribaculaceae bacterium]|nr:YjjG family noncanonical pyrimidine nucleotidase [Muribaculaceae bacterium]